MASRENYIYLELNRGFNFFRSVKRSWNNVFAVDAMHRWQIRWRCRTGVGSYTILDTRYLYLIVNFSTVIFVYVNSLYHFNSAYIRRTDKKRLIIVIVSKYNQRVHESLLLLEGVSTNMSNIHWNMIKELFISEVKKKRRRSKRTK